jgi:hypothetical protein
MIVEFDHLFICTLVNAPEVEQLVKLGLTEGQSNIHPGQGTACRRFFFHNAYLEFLWIHDEQEVRSEMVQPLHLWERWQYQQTGYSPFGLGLRSSRQTDEPVKLPFKTWAYRPPYLPEPLQIDIAENSASLTEPFLFHMTFGSRPDIYSLELRQPLEHAVGFKEVTGLRITFPGLDISKALETVEEVGLAKFTLGEAHLAEVIFDQGKREEVTDFRPNLPLVFRW